MIIRRSPNQSGMHASTHPLAVERQRSACMHALTQRLDNNRSLQIHAHEAALGIALGLELFDPLDGFL